MVGSEVFTTGHILLGVAVSLIVSVFLTAHNPITKPGRKYRSNSVIVRAVYHSAVFVTGVVVFMIPACLITFIMMWMLTWT